MNNQYDEIKNLIKSSRMMLKDVSLNETKEFLKKKNLINEEIEGDNLAQSTEFEDQQVSKDKKKSYRVSGGVITLHGKSKKDLELSTDEKMNFQETMDDFINDVSDLTEFEELNIYPNNIDWSGKVIEHNLDFYFSIGEENGVYVNGDMLKADEKLIELLNKLNIFYEKFKSKWAKVLSQRRKTTRVD